MGAEYTETVASGATPREAFAAARESALWTHGHGGYTGSMAEKSSYTFVGILPQEVDPRTLNEIAYQYYQFLTDGAWEEKMFKDKNGYKVFSHREERHSDPRPEALATPEGDRLLREWHEYADGSKWGPAACVEFVRPNSDTRWFMFGGWCSS